MAQNSWEVPDGFNAAEKKALKSVFDALRNAQKQIPPEALEALRFGNVEGFMSLIDWSGIEASFKPLQGILEAQAALSAKTLFTNASVESRLLFNLIDQRAVDWASARAGELIRSINEELRSSIRETVTQSLQGQLTVEQLGRRIRTNLPLLPRDAGAVDAFRQRNFEKFMQSGMSEAKAREKAEAKADRYAEKLTRSRSATIARSEVMRASNEGRYQGWESGVETGYIDNASVKEWIAEPDACEICLPMDGEIVAWNESFSDGEDMPPAHPNCRCTAAILPPDYADSVFTGQAEADEPDLEAASFDQQAEEVDPNALSAQDAFNAGLDDLEITNLFNSEYQNFDNPEVSATISEINKKKSNGTTQISVRGSFRDNDDKAVGEFIRIFVEEKDGVKWVYNDYLKLNPEWQGKGIGSSFSRFSESLYRKMGLDRIELRAGLDKGGYAWAKAGYEWNGKPIKILNSVYNKYAELTNAGFTDSANEIKTLWDSLRQGDVKSPDYPLPFEIANLEGPMMDGKPFAKWLLEGTEWEGVKKL